MENTNSSGFPQPILHLYMAVMVRLMYVISGIGKAMMLLLQKVGMKAVCMEITIASSTFSIMWQSEV